MATIHFRFRIPEEEAVLRTLLFDDGLGRAVRGIDDGAARGVDRPAVQRREDADGVLERARNRRHHSLSEVGEHVGDLRRGHLATFVDDPLGVV